MEIVVKKTNKIFPYRNNPRKNNSAVSSVMESIRQCGYIAPIIIDENGVILAGHTRYKAIKKLGWTECECIVKTGLSEDQKKKYRLLDNKTNELATWDFEMLADELDGLDFGNLDLDWGVEIEKSKEATEDDYEVCVPEQPKAKQGQIYQLGRHRLMCGDSTKEEAYAYMKIRECKHLLYKDQVRMLKGQIKAGDPEGAIKGLSSIIQKRRESHGKTQKRNRSNAV